MTTSSAKTTYYEHDGHDRRDNNMRMRNTMNKARSNGAGAQARPWQCMDSRLLAGLAMLALLWIALLQQPAQAASFDCAKAGTKIEKLICADADLSKLDEKLGELYRQVREAAAGGAKGDKYVKRRQMRWIEETRNPCLDRNCLRDVYLERIESLHRERNASVDSAAPHGGGWQIDKALARANAKLLAKLRQAQNYQLVRRIKTDYPLSELWERLDMTLLDSKCEGFMRALVFEQKRIGKLEPDWRAEKDGHEGVFGYAQKLYPACRQPGLKDEPPLYYGWSDSRKASKYREAIYSGKGWSAIAGIYDGRTRISMDYGGADCPSVIDRGEAWLTVDGEPLLLETFRIPRLSKDDRYVSEDDIMRRSESGIGPDWETVDRYFPNSIINPYKPIVIPPVRRGEIVPLDLSKAVPLIQPGQEYLFIYSPVHNPLHPPIADTVVPRDEALRDVLHRVLPKMRGTEPNSFPSCIVLIKQS
jgi:uncharacterized protein